MAVYVNNLANLTSNLTKNQYYPNPYSKSSSPFSFLLFGSKCKNPLININSFSLNHQNHLKNPVTVSASVTTAEKPSTTPEEIVLKPIKEISGTVNLPGSKSLSNRILLLAALSEVFNGHFLNSNLNSF